LDGNLGDDLLQGNKGSDTLVGNQGADTIQGDDDDFAEFGAAYDDATASYSGVTVSLHRPEINTGEATGDWVAVRNIIGSLADDFLEGADAVDGSTFGNNYLKAGYGDDTVLGLGGDDTLLGGSGADSMDGGAGIDTVVFDDWGHGLTLDLALSALSSDDAQGDSYISIERFVGSVHGDTMRGDLAANDLDGSTGDDILEGREGADTLRGGEGFDVASYEGASAGVVIDLAGTTPSNGDAAGDVFVSIEGIFGSTLIDKILGNVSANSIAGGLGSDSLSGRNGADTISGGEGGDSLNGGAGRDAFVFNAGLSKSNVDRIVKFSIKDDTIWLEKDVFTKLGKVGKSIGADALFADESGKAHDRSDRIIYETDTGKLFYDSNGSKAGGAVHFATLDKYLALTQADFLMV
jgi:Ca2+-binding RTX toxin-like protein